jgi:hypothetical protein
MLIGTPNKESSAVSYDAACFFVLGGTLERAAFSMPLTPNQAQHLSIYWRPTPDLRPPALDSMPTFLGQQSSTILNVASGGLR